MNWLNPNHSVLITVWLLSLCTYYRPSSTPTQGRRSSCLFGCQVAYLRAETLEWRGISGLLSGPIRRRLHLRDCHGSTGLFRLSQAWKRSRSAGRWLKPLCCADRDLLGVCEEPNASTLVQFESTLFCRMTVVEVRTKKRRKGQKQLTC